MEKLDDHTVGQNYNTRLSSAIFMVSTSTVGSIIETMLDENYNRNHWLSRAMSDRGAAVKPVIMSGI